MAGSYDHIKDGWSLIENMGDAVEAVQELMWLIERVIGETEARRLIDDEFYPMLRGERAKDGALLAVEEMLRQ